MKIEDYPDNMDAIINVMNRRNGTRDLWETYFSEWQDWTFRRQTPALQKYKMKSGDQNIVQWHKDVLGKFNSTFIIWSKRRYVWDFPDGASVVVQNGKGIAYEVPRDWTQQQALDSWRAYAERMLPKENENGNV